MPRNLNEIETHLQSLTKHDWNRLFELIPEIQNTEKFGEWLGEEDLKKGIIDLDAWEEDPIVGEFERTMYDLDLVIDFDWGSWEEGKKMASSGIVENLDRLTLLKLLTAVIRNDRYCSGALVNAFERGMVEKILLALKTIVDQSEAS
jgi:hypothetical protein